MLVVLAVLTTGSAFGVELTTGATVLLLLLLLLLLLDTVVVIVELTTGATVDGVAVMLSKQILGTILRK